jgi:hypothetical protein
MTPQQQIAIAQHCRLACETAMPQFCTVFKGASVVLSVNFGYE